MVDKYKIGDREFDNQEDYLDYMMTMDHVEYKEYTTKKSKESGFIHHLDKLRKKENK